MSRLIFGLVWYIFRAEHIDAEYLPCEGHFSPMSVVERHRVSNDRRFTNHDR